LGQLAQQHQAVGVGEEPNAFLVSQAHLLGIGHALAVADGEGRNSVWLAQQGLSVDAFDFSAPAIVKAQALAAKHHVNINFTCSDWQSFDWKAAHYDLVAGIFFQFATPYERSDLFEKIKLSLKAGGVLVIQGYGKTQVQHRWSRQVRPSLR
jgi:2-polyprenyl-3-methyl-5-hydroxy-6-metoxy-1,4-benzoquinol methylase